MVVISQFPLTLGHEFSGILIYIPAFLVSSNIVKMIFGKFTAERVVPVIDFGDRLPQEAKTAIIIPVLGVSKNQMMEVLNNLHHAALNNGTHNISYCVLIDFLTTMPSEEQTDIGSFISEKIHRYNKSYKE